MKDLMSWVEVAVDIYKESKALLLLSIVAGFGLWELVFGKKKLVGIITFGGAVVLMLVIGVFKMF